MRLIHKITFTVKEAMAGLGRNLYKTCIQMLVSFLALCMFGFFLVGYMNVQTLASKIDKKVEITVFLNDEASEADVVGIRNTIESDTRIKSYQYIDKESAMEDAEKMFKNNAYVLDSLKDMKNPFPASFVITLNDASQVKNIAEHLSTLSGVTQNGVKFGQNYVDKLLSLTKFLRYASYAVLAFLFVISVFFMFSIIDLILSTKRQEYLIMNMVGASKLQIKFPFYLQGIILGTLSSVLAFACVRSMYALFLQKYGFLSTVFNFEPVAQIENTLFTYVVVTGLSTGLIATWFALKRFVKVSKVVKNRRKLQSFTVEDKKNRIRTAG